MRAPPSIFSRESPSAPSLVARPRTEAASLADRPGRHDDIVVTGEREAAIPCCKEGRMRSGSPRDFLLGLGRYGMAHEIALTCLFLAPWRWWFYAGPDHPRQRRRGILLIRRGCGCSL